MCPSLLPTPSGETCWALNPSLSPGPGASWKPLSISQALFSEAAVPESDADSFCDLEKKKKKKSFRLPTDKESILLSMRQAVCKGLVSGT